MTSSRGQPVNSNCNDLSVNSCGSLLSSFSADLARSITPFNDEDLLEDVVQVRNKTLACAAALICGTMNNLSFCIISGASQSFGRQFHMESKVTVITTAMNFSALAAVCISTRLLLHLRFYTRVALVISMTTIAYLGVAYSATLEGAAGFTLVTILSCLAGMAGMIGETTNLAFYKVFPHELIGCWGAGTGCAGILGGELYILLGGPLGLSNASIFVLIAPTVLVYWAAFHYLHSEATRSLKGFSFAHGCGGRATSVNGTRCFALWNFGDCGGAAEELQPSSGTAPATWANIKQTIACSGGIMFNLVAVYFLEYTIFPGLDDRETLCATKSWYTTMWVCYNVGVTVSRFSVAVCRITRVWLLTTFQFVNVVGWTLEVYTGVVRNSMPHEMGLYIMAAWMVLTGLCGGATYGNCMYLFNCRPGIPDRLRELGINLGFVMSYVGITVANFSFVVLNETVMAKSLLYPDGCSAQ